MSRPVVHGELFAGIGGFGEGFDDAGIEMVWHVENNPVCQSVLRRHSPDALLLSDVRECGKHNLPQVDVITFGSPCQDLSLAGKRKGFDGERSGLYFEAIRIIKELRPTIAVWENVPGALSSNSGRDFGAALDALADAGAVDIAWRVLDAQWFGVAQRRRRLFIVASFRDGTSAAEILFESESCQRDTPPSREAGQGITRTLTSSTGRSKFDPDRGLAVPQVAAANCSRIGKGGYTDPVNDNIIGLELGNQGSGGNVGWHSSAQPFRTLTDGGPPGIAHCLRAEGADASEDGTGRGTPLVNQGMAVRRLTPTECERLQGFPDGWTALDAEGKPISDAQRYKMLGNAVCVNVTKWIGKRIVAALAGKGE